MISKKDLRDQLEIKEKKVAILETQETLYDNNIPYHNIVLDVLEFLTQPKEDQYRRKEEWSKYYEAVKGTNAYKRYEMQREAFKKRDFDLVKKIASVARKALAENKREFVRPKGIDFESLYHNSRYQEYLRLKNAVASLRKQLGEEDTFETAKKIFA